MPRPPDPRPVLPLELVTNACWVPLTRGRFALIDAEDFDRISSVSWRCLHTSGVDYAIREEGGETIFMEHVVLGLTQTTDHRNGHGLDNRKCNLRPSTRSQNQANQKRRKDNTSGYKGVAWNAGARKWAAYITVRKKRFHLGLYVNPKEAAREYNTAALTHFGEFARLNEIP